MTTRAKVTYHDVRFMSQGTADELQKEINAELQRLEAEGHEVLGFSFVGSNANDTVDCMSVIGYRVRDDGDLSDVDVAQEG